MLLDQIDNFDIFRPKMDSTKEVLHAIATFTADISPAFPYVNAELGGWDYDQTNQVLLLKLSDGKWITLHPQKIAIRGARDMEEAQALLAWIQGQINDIYARREAITPRYVSQAGLKVMEILKLLPMTNCKACGYAACMAYAAALQGRGDQPGGLPALMGRKIPGKAGKAPGLPGKLRLAGPGCGIGERRSMYITKSAYRALILMLLLLGAPLAAGATIGPKAQVPETTFDFGEIFEDRELTHTFTIKNIGDALLEIKDIDSDCACTAADSDRRIPPGGQGRIKLTIAPYSVLRQFAKKTKVFFNDPDQRQVVLTMKGYGKPFIEIQPSHIIRFRGKPGEELRDQVRFISHLPGHWEIKAFKTNIPQYIDVTIKAEQPGKIYVVEVRNKRQEAGNYAGVIELSTTSEKRPRLIMRVFAELSLPSAGSP